MKRLMHCALFAVLGLAMGQTATAQQPPVFSMTSMVSTEAPNFRIRPGATLMWQRDSIRVYQDERFGVASLESLFVGELDDALLAKGFQITESQDEATFGIGLLLALSTELDDEDILQQFGATPGLGAATVSERMEKGTVALLLLDPQNKEALWKVILQGFADFDASPELRKDRVRRVVDQMLEPLPDVPN